MELKDKNGNILVSEQEYKDIMSIRDALQSTLHSCSITWRKLDTLIKQIEKITGKDNAVQHNLRSGNDKSI